MKLGIIASPETTSFRKAAAMGLEFLEFCINVGSDVEGFLASVDSLKQESIKTGVGVQSIGRWGSDRINAQGVIEEELRISYRLIDAASELGCPNFVCGINDVDGLSLYAKSSYAIEYLSKLIEYGKAKNVSISTYNCSWNNFVVEPTAWSIIHGHLPELGIKFDPSHSRYGGRDYLKEMRDWGQRFNHIHIKGSVIIDGRRFDDPPAGLDQTDWGTFMALLYGKGYAGGLSLEPHSEVWSGELGDKGVLYSIQYMRNMMF